MATYQTPGVYVEEISTLPPSVAPVATAIPAFIGYTQKGVGKVERISNLLEYRALFGGPFRSTFAVSTHLDEKSGQYVTDSIERKDGDRDPTAKRIFPLDGADSNPPKYHLFYSVAHFFDNGGGKCYIVSVGDYDSDPSAAALKAGLDKLKQEDEPTLLVFADAVGLGKADYYNLCEFALDQCRDTQDRFGVFDVKAVGSGSTAPIDSATDLRNELSHEHLAYGAAYYPYLHTTLNYRIVDDGEEEATGEARVDVTVRAAPDPQAPGYQSRFGVNGIVVSHQRKDGDPPKVQITKDDVNAALDFEIADDKLRISNADAKTGRQVSDAWQTWKSSNDTGGFDVTMAGTGVGIVQTTGASSSALAPFSAPGAQSTALNALRATKTALYNHVKKVLTRPRVILPPSAAMVGIYARVDRDRGVWKAPANVAVAAISAPVVKITHEDQAELNIDANAGKSINAIRTFAGKGTLVWGARTLAGNDNEWRYVPVRRLFIMIEESAKKSTSFAVFEPNDATTWLKVKGMIEAFLYGLWEKGALQGSSPDKAYFVNVGLGTTMTTQDILEGRMIVEIGIAAVRPAEFIILRFMHKLAEA